MADVRELAAPLLGGMLRVPGSETVSCPMCHSSVNGHLRCYPCSQAHRMLGGQPPTLLPITLSADLSQTHYVLRQYKDSSDPTVRSRFALQLAALVELFAARHTDCIGPFDVVTCVPSQKKRTAFLKVVARLGRYKDHYEPLLTVASDEDSHTLSTSRFTASADARGRRVLLLDDTFTQGASVFSATHALRAAGATVETILVVGRHIKPSYPPTAAMLDQMKGQRWSEDDCVVCRPAETLF